MKKAIFILNILIVGLVYSQEFLSYHNKEKRIGFRVSSNEYYVKSHKNIGTIEGANYQNLSANSGILKRSLSGNLNSKRQTLKSLRKLNLSKVEPVLIYEDGTQQIVDGKIILKVKPNTNVHEALQQWNFTIIQDEFDHLLYHLSSEVYTTEDIFNIINQMQNNSNIVFVEPDFIRLIKPQTSDPLFSQQWAIKNYTGIDMKVENAWKYSTGKGVKVAIIDEGVDLNHPDLKANLLAGYDATGNNSQGACDNNDAHGTSCAGIVAAVANNDIGITGIAYDAKILPLRIAYGIIYNGEKTWAIYDSWAAKAINWAWQNGADILNNSWGGGSYSSSIANAIKNAVEKGRNGKGCIVLFASGNSNTDVNFPAILPNVLAVGATSMCDERKSYTSCDGEYRWGSNYGRGSYFPKYDGLDIPKIDIKKCHFKGFKMVFQFL